MIEFGALYDLRNPRRPDWFIPWPRFYQESFDHMVEMENLGADIVSFCEHHGDVDGFNPHITETLTLVAERTSRVSLGTYIIQLPYYHPVMLAERLAFVDIISGGRLRALGLGQIGSIWDMEMEMLGVNPKNRPSLMSEGLELLQRSWTAEEPFDFQGKRFRSKNIQIFTKPLQKPHPDIHVAAMAEASADRVARLGHHPAAPGAFYDGLTSKERWDQWWPMWRKVCARHDRDPDDAIISTVGMCFVTDDPDRAAALHAESIDHGINYESRPSIRPYGDSSLSHGGDQNLVLEADPRRCFLTPEEAIAEFRDTFAERAPDQFYLSATRPGMSWELATEYHANFIDKVLPALQDLPTRATRLGAKGSA